MAVKIRVIQIAKCDEEEIAKVIADFDGITVEDINKTTQQFLNFAAGFEAQYSNLKNLKTVYAEELRKMRFYQ